MLIKVIEKVGVARWDGLETWATAKLEPLMNSLKLIKRAKEKINLKLEVTRLAVFIITRNLARSGNLIKAHNAAN